MFWLLLALAAFVFLFMGRAGLVSPTDASDMLREGAEVVDVRTDAEFRQGHLEGAINIPLNRLKEDVTRFIPDKATPVLLHCVSGGRSAMARRMLTSLGYTRAHNLGSYSRAAKVTGRGTRI